LSLGQKLQVEKVEKHSLTFGVVLLLLGRLESKKVEGRPGPLHTVESDLSRLLFSRSILLLLTMGFRHSPL